MEHAYTLTYFPFMNPGERTYEYRVCLCVWLTYASHPSLILTTRSPTPFHPGQIEGGGGRGLEYIA